MKALELIKQLQEIVNNKGDYEVSIFDNTERTTKEIDILGENGNICTK